MLRRFFSQLFGGSQAASASASSSDATYDGHEASALAKGSNQLGIELYARICGAAGNLALSPASISAALAMTYGGAKGKTADEMKATAHFTDAPDAAMTRWGRELRRLVEPDRPLKLRIANRLFGEKSYEFDATYLERTKLTFDAPLEALDFKGAPDAARGTINRWVEGQTEDRIKDLLPDTSIDAETRLVLVNAIYFLADWQEPFDKMFTRREPFHLSATSKKDVWTMNRAAHLPYARTDGVQIVELVYKGGQAAMWIVVPDEIEGLGAIERKLSDDGLTAWRRKLSTAYVGVELPRFEVNPAQSLSLKDELTALGMVDAFDRARADFTGIANPPDPYDRLVIGNVIHKAFVKTDEKGTEAAAATAVEMMRAGGGPPPKPIPFKADRPFLFFIFDRASSLILFMGRVSDPGSA